MNGAAEDAKPVEAFPRIVLSAGEPAGIGPDLCLMTALKPFPCDLSVVGEPALFQARAKQLGMAIAIETLQPEAPARLHRPGHLGVRPIPGAEDYGWGRLNRKNASYVLGCIDHGVAGCLAGRYDALVTGPVHKGIINEAGIPFTGHTEYIAARTGGFPVMMLATAGLRVALATTHLPLHCVSSAITDGLLESVIRVLHGDLSTRFGVPDPRILVCGLNPHAGEGGHLGSEETEIIEPVLAALAGEGMRLIGPLPADTAFLPKYLETADAVLAMYHDQGLPVLKFAGFGRAVNITLGLPIIRTSVDHGTALDLAGTGRADSGSLETAIQAAIELCRGVRQGGGASH